MGTPEINQRTNRRGITENYVEGLHLKLGNLRRAVEENGLEHGYLFKDDIPAYPPPEFCVHRLKHDTDLDGLKGIRSTGGFMSPHPHGSQKISLLWFSLVVGPEEIQEAERTLLETKYPDRTEEQIQNQQSFMEKFASSPAFQRSSRLGSYRFTLSVEEVLEAYKDQFCSGAEPVMRVMETVLYKQEVMYVVLVHSPDDQDQFSEYPLLADNPDPVCTFQDGRFMWTSEAMCNTHRYEFVQDDDERRMEAMPVERQFFVWDHVSIALHLGDNEKVLKFDVDKLREKLTFCDRAEVVVHSSIRFQDFPKAEQEVKKLWPDYPLPLMRDGQRAPEVLQEDQQPAEEEDDLSENLGRLELSN